MRFLTLLASIAIAMTLLAAAPASRPTTRPTSQPAVQRLHLFISGRVQGVGFRAFTFDTGTELGLTGWVKNLPDGRVEAEVQGPPDKVQILLTKVKRGPSSARVDKLESTEQTPSTTDQRFEIRY